MHFGQSCGPSAASAHSLRPCNSSFPLPTNAVSKNCSTKDHELKSLPPAVQLAQDVRFLPQVFLSNIRVFAVMKNVGSLYEEMARQLIMSGSWKCVFASQGRGTSQLITPETGEPIEQQHVSLLLGEKLPTEKYIASRRTRATSGRRRSTQLLRRGSTQSLVVNYVENLRCITLKGSMVSTLLVYYGNSWDVLGKYLPVTFRLIPRQSKSDERRFFFLKHRQEPTTGTYWIAKSSSGCHGDNVEIFGNSQRSIDKMIKFIDGQKDPYMWVVQQYLDRPLLYHRRKFDVRCWVLLLGEKYEIYIHEHLVMRMSSIEYTRDRMTTSTETGRLAHITNHCVQEASDTYALFEKGNELWRDHLDSVIRYKGRRLREKGIYHEGANPDLEPSLKNTILPQVHHIVVETMLAARDAVPNPPPSTRCFQVFGYDFLIDDMFRVWLLEINGSPGVAARLLRRIVTDTIEIALRPYFPNELKHLEQQQEGGRVRRNGPRHSMGFYGWRTFETATSSKQHQYSADFAMLMKPSAGDVARFVEYIACIDSSSPSFFWKTSQTSSKASYSPDMNGHGSKTGRELLHMRAAHTNQPL